MQKVRFLYVGSQVKRKGGAEVLKAFDQLRKKYDSFSLTFIGNLNDNYNNFYLDEEEKKKSNVLSHADWLEYHEKVSNEEVLKLAKQAHVGLLPSQWGILLGFLSWKCRHVGAR